MLRIAISTAAFDAIDRTMPFGSVNFEAGVDDKGERHIWPRARLSIGCHFGAGDGSAGLKADYWGNWGEPGRYTGGGWVPAGVSGVFARTFKPVTITLSEGRQRLTRTCPK